MQGGHGTGKTGNLVLTFSRQGKHREFCFDTGKNFETHGKYFSVTQGKNLDTGRASSSYFFLFFPIFLSILLFFLFFSNFLLFFLFFSHFTYNKEIFVRDLNILSLFKYVVYRVHFFFS